MYIHILMNSKAMKEHSTQNTDYLNYSQNVRYKQFYVGSAVQTGRSLMNRQTTPVQYNINYHR